MNDIIENNESNVEGFRELLWTFRALPQTKISRTFMEVSGYPHYENVCSNILGFYFDPAAEHSMKDLLLTAFMRMTGNNEESLPNKVSVLREYGTKDGNRIDLIVVGDTFTIGIENKIFHWLANDLTDYACAIDNLGRDKAVIIKAVLGLKPMSGSKPLEGGFISYTYGQLWHHVREMLGHYITQADPKWVTYLVDFMETTINLAGENMELKQTDQFFIEHNGVIEKMIMERNAFLARLSQKIVELSGMMEGTSEAQSLRVPPYKYFNDRLVLDFKELTNGYEISFDFYLKPSGWELQLFGRGNQAYLYLLELIKQPALKEKMGSATLMPDGKRYCVQKWDVQADLDEIKVALCSWMVAVCKAARGVHE